ncbi:hypothetical protein CWR48_14220 [Oceanobacillus arenosus]|uniref:Uncharacterized protein n=2 Tax=Oceanobacillus arenosus TaxID=1229153 RepID=A0A3D8PQ76_9BACI|nr:hypothetical protein CWR48_14220 [Oceanobacillus arenosus]
MGVIIMDRNDKEKDLTSANRDGIDLEFSEEMVDIYEKEASIKSKNAEKLVRGINSTPTMRNG